MLVPRYSQSTHYHDVHAQCLTIQLPFHFRRLHLLPRASAEAAPITAALALPTVLAIGGIFTATIEALPHQAAVGGLVAGVGTADIQAIEPLPEPIRLSRHRLRTTPRSATLALHSVRNHKQDPKRLLPYQASARASSTSFLPKLGLHRQ